MDEQVRRLADRVREAISDNEEEFLRAEGVAVLTVAKLADEPRIALDSRKLLVRVGGAERLQPASRLGGDIHQLADDVRRAMISDQVLVRSAREVVITIQLSGPRPSFELGYKGRKA